MAFLRVFGLPLLQKKQLIKLKRMSLNYKRMDARRIIELMQLIDTKGQYKSFPLTRDNAVLHSGGQVKIDLLVIGKILVIRRKDKAGNLHSSRGPADIMDDAGYLCINYYKHGVKHAVNQPSKIHYNARGWVDDYEYRVNGKLHNENGPATLWGPPHMLSDRRKYFLNDVEYTEEEHRTMTVVSRHRDIILALLPQPIAEEMIDAM